MTSTEKEVLHYQVIANMAHTIEKVAIDLASLSGADYINTEKLTLRKKHLVKYFDELARLVEKE